jgi:hypothetical protein
MNGLPPALDNRIGYRKVLTDIGSQPNLFFKNFCLDKGVHFIPNITAIAIIKTEAILLEYISRL